MPWVLLAANQSSRSSATAVGVPTNVRERPSPDLGAKASRNVHALSAAANIDSSERFESVSWYPMTASRSSAQKSMPVLAE